MNDENDTGIKVTECEPTAKMTISGGGDVSPVSQRLPPELQFYGSEFKESCDPVFDYENLLRKYIRWVRECEGVNFITEGTFYEREKFFIDAEWEELIRLSKA